MDRVSRCQNSVDLAPVRPFICRKCMLTITEVMSRGNASCHTRVCTNKLTLSRREKNKKQKLFLFLEDVSTRVREVKGYSFRAGMWCSRGWIDGKMYRSVNQINLFTHTSVRLCVSVTPRPSECSRSLLRLAVWIWGQLALQQRLDWYLEAARKLEQESVCV